MSYYSQHDVRWSAKSLGTGGLTIGISGDLVTAAAMMLSDWEVPTDPGRLSDWLKFHGGFVDRNRFVFDSLCGLGATLQCLKYPEDVSELWADLDHGVRGLVLVEFINTKEHQFQPHWAYLAGHDEHGALVVDPWDRDPILKSVAVIHGQTDRIALRLVALYRRNSSRVIPFEMYAGVAQSQIYLSTVLYAEDSPGPASQFRVTRTFTGVGM